MLMHVLVLEIGQRRSEFLRQETMHLTVDEIIYLLLILFDIFVVGRAPQFFILYVRLMF
jgi:hypothetical protein